MSDGKGGSLEDRGQHKSTEGVAGDSGQRHITPNPRLGRESVPASPKDGDINTERKS